MLALLLVAMAAMVLASGQGPPDDGGSRAEDTEPPVADAGANVTVPQGTQVTLDANNSTDNVAITAYEWSFGYGGGKVQRSGPTLAFWFNDPGTYIVSLMVTDAAGNYDVDEVTVRVLDTVAPLADPGPDIEANQHEAVVLDGSASTDNAAVVSWVWTFVSEGDPQRKEGKRVVVTFDVAGEYLVTLNVSDADGNWALGTLRVTVLDCDPPVADAGPDTVVDQFEPADLDSANCSDNVGITAWKWTVHYLGDEVELWGPYPTFTFDEAGEYAVHLVVYDEVGNLDDDWVNITVRDVVPPVSVMEVVYEFDQGTFQQLDGSGSHDNVGVLLWTWRIVRGEAEFAAHGERSSFHFEEAGFYQVHLTVQDLAGNTNTSQSTVYARDTRPPVAVVDAKVDAAVGQPVELNGSASSDNMGIASWTWLLEYRGREHRLQGERATFTFDRPGSYGMSLTVEDEAGWSDHASFQVVVAGTGEEPEDEDGGWVLWAAAAVAVAAVLLLLYFLLPRYRQPVVTGEDPYHLHP